MCWRPGRTRLRWIASAAVDVADLSSGVTTVVLAGKERLLGRPSQHYGALTRADAPLPELPVR